jgi:hypothetical protein
MDDQVITPKLATALHQRALERSNHLVWKITEDGPGLAGVLLARLITDRATPYVLVAPSLKDPRIKLPPGLVRTDRQLADPLDVLEVWVDQTQRR